MKREAIDFFLVADRHLVIHDRLTNWARYVAVRQIQHQASIWRMGKSNGRQWHQPELSVPVNQLDGHKMEKAVADLPDMHRDALRWSYVYRINPSHMRRYLGVTDAGLYQLVKDGRNMLVNRAV